MENKISKAVILIVFHRKMITQFIWPDIVDINLDKMRFHGEISQAPSSQISESLKIEALSRYFVSLIIDRHSAELRNILRKFVEKFLFYLQSTESIWSPSYQLTLEE